MKLLMVMLVALVVVVMVLPSDVFSRRTKSLTWRTARSSRISKRDFGIKDSNAVMFTIKRKFPSMSLDDITQLIGRHMNDTFTHADTEEPDFFVRLLKSSGVDGAEYLEYYRAVRLFVESPKQKQLEAMLWDQYGSSGSLPVEELISSVATASVEELAASNAPEVLMARINKAAG